MNWGFLRLFTAVSVATILVSCDPATDNDAPNITVAQIQSYQAEAITIDGTRLFIADEEGGVKIYSLTDVTSPRSIATITTDGVCEDVVVEGDFLYVADGQKGIKIYDISDIANPVLVGSKGLGPNSYAIEVVVVNNTLYISCGNAGISIVDATDKANMSILGSYDTPNWAEDMKVALGSDGSLYVFVSDGYGSETEGSGVFLLNVTDPANIFEHSKMETAVDAECFTLAPYCGGYANVGISAERGTGMSMFYFDNDLKAHKLSTVDLGVESFDLAFINGYGLPTQNGGVLYADIVVISSGRAGLKVYNVTDPTAPYFYGTVATSGFAQDVKNFNNRYFVVADGKEGVKILDTDLLFN